MEEVQLYSLKGEQLAIQWNLSEIESSFKKIATSTQ